MTGNLTNDMTRLRGEIAASRDSRAETRERMQAAISRMLSGFGEARSEMATQTKAELGEFVARVKETVTELRQTVAQLREGFQADLAGAHQAWQGAGPARTILKASFRTEDPSDEVAPKAKKKKKR
jgi:signal transduction histidine kinase